MAATAGTIKGTITDRQTKEPLTGATVQVSGTAQGAVADLDGNYTLELKTEPIPSPSVTSATKT